MNTTHRPDVHGLRGRAIAASTAVFVVLIGPVCMVLATFTFGSSQNTDEAKFGMALIGGAFVFILLGWPISAILMIRWLSLARANADAMFPAHFHRLSSGWAIGGWFVPLANWIIPPLVVTDVVRASNPTGDSLRAVWVWWAGWVAANLILIGGFVLLTPLEYPDGAATLAQCLWTATALYTASALAFRSVAMTVAHWQDDRAAGRNGAT